MPRTREGEAVGSKRIIAGALLVLVWTTAAVANDHPPATSVQEVRGPLDAVRTVVYFPFKGVVCVVGALASLPVYWLSGLDPEVKNDTAAIRAKYCSQEYLFSPEWSK